MSIEPITIPMSIETNEVTIESAFDAKIEVVEGGDITVQSLTVLNNGTTVAPEGKAYSPVVVNVPNTYSASDEGKVVKNGALTSQTTATASANGDIDTTTIKQVTVAVPASAVDSGTKNINTNGTHDVVGYASAAVSVPASAVDSGTKNITSNGDNQDVVGYAKVNVAVPNSYSAADEGKVVSSGALVSQTSDSTTQNGTFDTTLINSFTVNVSGGGSSGTDVTVASAKSGGQACCAALLNAANATTGKTYVINAKTLAAPSTSQLFKGFYIALSSLSSSTCNGYGGYIRNNTSGTAASVAWGGAQGTIAAGDVYTVTEINNYPQLT